MVAYQVTKNLRPQLGVELTADRRVKLTGEVRLADIALTRRWPSPDGGQISIIKGLGVKFSIPTPVPAVTAYGEIRGSLGLGYGVGPVMLRGVMFTGELYPFEDDPQVKARLTRHASSSRPTASCTARSAPTSASRSLLGAVGAKGGVEITPRSGSGARAGSPSTPPTTRAASASPPRPTRRGS